MISNIINIAPNTIHICLTYALHIHKLIMKMQK